MRSTERVLFTESDSRTPCPRLQISIEEELDEALAVEAARRRMSKAALIRELVRERLGRGPPADPMAALIGDLDDEAGDIDRVVRRSRSPERLEELPRRQHTDPRSFERDEVGIAADDRCRAGSARESDQVVVIGITRHGRRTLGIGNRLGKNGKALDVLIHVGEGEEAAELLAPEHGCQLSEQPRADDEIEPALPRSAEHLGRRAGGGDDRRDEHARVEDDPEHLLRRPALGAHRLELGIRESERLVRVERVGGVPRPDAVDDLESEIPLKGGLDHLVVVLAGPCGSHLRLPQQALVEVDGRLLSRHYWAILTEKRISGYERRRSLSGEPSPAR